MVQKALRVPAQLWEDAKDVAAKRDETISDVIRRALENYIRRNR